MRRAAAQKAESLQAPATIDVVVGEALGRALADLRETIARRAYQLYETRGGEHGHHAEDWQCAEAEVVQPLEGNVAEADGSVTLRGFIPDVQVDKVGIDPQSVLVWLRPDPAQSKASGDKRASKEPSANVLRFHFSHPADLSRPSVNLVGQVLTVSLPKTAGA